MMLQRKNVVSPIAWAMLARLMWARDPIVETGYIYTQQNDEDSYR